jgi:4-amino-4-deoxy-L-arabinose transferase-like glycosyltransferase
MSTLLLGGTLSNCLQNQLLGKAYKPNKTMKIYNASLAREHKFPLVIILLGILFSLYLQLQIPAEVFFSGDAGLKLLLTKQFALGNFYVDLALPVESWIRNLWSSGLFPFEPPFVYNIDNRYYIQYPFLFSLITAPFYKLFGWRGLYVIPLVSVWIVWWRFYVVCQGLRIGIVSTSFALIALIFASPLTLYGAMFWEHTIAVALAFYGLSIILVSTPHELSKSKALVSGILVGLSVWFRPELILVVLTICVLFFASNKLQLSYKKKRFILIGMLLTTALFLVINTIAYNHPLGIYSFPLGLKAPPPGSEELSNFGMGNQKGIGRLARALVVFLKLNVRLLLYFPLTLVPLLYLLIPRKFKKIRLKSNILMLLAICCAISFAIPLIGWEGAKEWGPRYLLILVPILTVITTIILNWIMRIQNYRLRTFSLVILLSFLVSGTFVNTYLGTVHLRKDYHQRVLPALTILQANPNQVVAVSNHYISQELASIFTKKVFFLTKSNNELKKMALVLRDKGYKSFLYLVAESNQEKLDFINFKSANKNYAINFSNLGKFGTYILYEASIDEPSLSTWRAIDRTTHRLPDRVQLPLPDKGQHQPIDTRIAHRYHHQDTGRCQPCRLS